MVWLFETSTTPTRGLGSSAAFEIEKLSDASQVPGASCKSSPIASVASGALGPLEQPGVPAAAMSSPRSHAHVFLGDKLVSGAARRWKK
jgi:hypothetical protein